MTLPCSRHSGTSGKMAKRHVYSVANLQECMEYLEDSDDSAKDVTWKPVNNLHECVEYLEDSDDSAKDITWKPSPKTAIKRGKKSNNIENMLPHHPKRLQEVKKVLPFTYQPSPKKAKKQGRKVNDEDIQPGHSKQSHMLSNSRSAANSLPKPLPIALTLTKTPPVLLSASLPAASTPDPPEPATVASILTKAPNFLLSASPPAENSPDSPEPAPVASKLIEAPPIMLSASPPAANSPDPTEPVPVTSLLTKAPLILLSVSPPAINSPDSQEPAPVASIPIEAPSDLLFASLTPENSPDTPEPVSIASTLTKACPVLLSASPPVENSPDSPEPAPVAIEAPIYFLLSSSPPAANSLPDHPPVTAIVGETTPPVLPSNSPPGAHSPPGSPSIIQAQADEEIESQSSRSSRKRKKDITTWKKNIRKRRRNEGKEYLSARGKTVPAKVLETYNHVCRYQCDTFTEDERKKIHSEFWKLGNWEAQTSFIKYCVRIVKPKRSINKKKKSSVITLSNKRVCKDFFLKTLTISNRRFTNAAFTKTLVEGLPLFDKRGKHEPGNKTKEDKLKEVREHISSFPKFKSHYSREEAPLKKYLSPELSVSKMYSLYKNKLIEEGKQPVREQIYRKVFNTDFNLGFYKLRSDTCNTCDKLENLYKCEVNAERKLNIKQEKEDHLSEVERIKLAKQSDKNNDDNSVHVITFDLEKTLPTPYIQTNLVYYKRQFWTYNLGIHDCKTGDAHMYMWGEHIASRGASEVASCLLKYIRAIVPEDCQHLIAYSDSCGGQNRNQIICKLWMYVVAHTSIATVDHKFMVSGHSYLENDADFSHIEKRKKKAQHIYVPDDWMKLVENTRKKFTVHRMEQNDFISTDPVAKAVVNRKMDTTKNKVNWLKMRWMRFLKEQPKSMFFKESLDVETQFRHINMDAKKGNIPKALPQLRDATVKIKPAKIKDLMDLLKFIPPIHHDFYNSLTCDENQPTSSTNRPRGRPRQENMQETDEESILDYPLD